MSFPPSAALRAHACALSGVCCAPLPARSRHAGAIPSVERVRDYLQAVYPAGKFGDRAAVPDSKVRHFFASRHWFYEGASGLTPGEVEPVATIIRPSHFACDDKFFGSGLLQRDLLEGFHGVLPCTPGGHCVRRQAAHLPECAAQLAARGRDVWVEVWHLAHDGRQQPRPPAGWSDFLDHGASGWWYIHAPGSGIFYHAGRTLAAPSKAAMLAKLIGEWLASESKRALVGGEARRYIDEQLSRGKAPSLLRIFSNLSAGRRCSEFGWGRWRCVGDHVPSDNWDELMLTLGRVLGYDSLYLTALMWGRALGGGRKPPSADSPPPRGGEAEGHITSDAISDAEVTAEFVDLRLPPPASPTSTRYPYWDLAARESSSTAWAAHVHASGRLSLRDPLHPADDARARPCDFNATGGPTNRLACAGHVSWRVRGETQRQQACTRRAPAGAAGAAGQRASRRTRVSVSPGLASLSS